MTRRAQGIAVALAVILGIALASGGVIVFAGSGKDGRSTAAAAMTGTNGPNRLIGTNRHDVLDGRGGGDVIRGRGGPDTLRGGPGADTIAGGKKFDSLFGGPGDDTIKARDRQADEIDCGPGHDVAILDRHEDGVYDCEKLKIPGPSQGRPPQ
jgi:Ca2+-binding RTX toxin-like protein